MAAENLQANKTTESQEMNSTEFTYKTLEKKCPGCGDKLLFGNSYLFCEREHGTLWPKWRQDGIPVATRTARSSQFTIEGEDGFWRIPSHAHADLKHSGPPDGSVIASILRYRSRVPTAVVFVRRKPRSKKSK